MTEKKERAQQLKQLSIATGKNTSQTSNLELYSLFEDISTQYRFLKPMILKMNENVNNLCTKVDALESKIKTQADLLNQLKTGVLVSIFFYFSIISRAKIMTI